TTQRQNAQANDKKRQEMEADFEEIASWLPVGPRKETPPAHKDENPFAKGYRKFADKCSECHTYRRKEGDDFGKGPDFTGYGDTEWIRGMIADPAGRSRYGKNNRMPTFIDFDKPGGELARQQLKLMREEAIEKAGENEAEKKKA